jgi:hypothetical protein
VSGCGNPSGSRTKDYVQKYLIDYARAKQREIIAERGKVWLTPHCRSSLVGRRAEGKGSLASNSGVFACHHASSKPTSLRLCSSFWRFIPITQQPLTGEELRILPIFPAFLGLSGLQIPAQSI